MLPLVLYFKIMHLFRLNNIVGKKFTDFFFLLQICLWGNRFDLSLNIGKSNSFNNDPLETIALLDKYILVNDIDDIWNKLNDSNNNHRPKRIGKL